MMGIQTNGDTTAGSCGVVPLVTVRGAGIGPGGVILGCRPPGAPLKLACCGRFPEEPPLKLAGESEFAVSRGRWVGG